MGSSLPITGIYGIIHVPSIRFYIGQARDIGLRWAVHRANLKRGNHHCIYLQRAWDKYGSAQFSWVVLERCVVEYLDEMEQWWMDSTPGLFNARPTAGHSRGYTHSAKTKLKMRFAAKLVAATQEERKRRSDRAKAMHAVGRIKYHDRLIMNARMCKLCGQEFALERHPITGAWRQNKLCPSCKADYKLYTPSIQL